MFVNRLGEMVNFELGKERKKDFFVLSRAWDKEKKFWVPMKDQTFTELRTCHLSYYLVDPSCMQDACHMNFVIDLAHCEVCVAQWRGIRRGLRIFYLSHAREKTKKFVFFLYLCMFKHKIIIIMIRLQLIIVMNTLAHREKEFFFPLRSHFRCKKRHFDCVLRVFFRR